MTLSVAFGLLSYVLVMITASYSRLGDAQNIALLTLSLLLVPAFAYWMHRQERLGKPAIRTIIRDALLRGISVGACLGGDVAFCEARVAVLG